MCCNPPTRTVFCSVLLLAIATFNCSTSFAQSAQAVDNPAATQSAQKLDVEAVMKQMRLVFKRAMTTSDQAEFLEQLTKLQSLTEQVRQGNYPKDKNSQYQQGFDKVLKQISLARTSAEQGDLTLAQSHLAEVDSLRKEYHKLRKPSFWQLLFGN